MKSYTLRLRSDEDRAALDALMEATNQATQSKAIWTSINAFPALVETIARQNLTIARIEAETNQLNRAAAKADEASEKLTAAEVASSAADILYRTTQTGFAILVETLIHAFKIDAGTPLADLDSKDREIIAECCQAFADGLLSPPDSPLLSDLSLSDRNRKEV